MERLQEFISANAMLVLVFAGLTVALVVNEVRSYFRGFKGITPAQLTHLINRENATVIDLRGQGEFEKGHIIGARHLLPSEAAPEHKLLAKAKESPLVLVCGAGMVSSGIAAKLVKAGFKQVSVLDGGQGAWAAAGLPVVKGKA
jgi:rhodanese-related sulfurtransferase